MMNGDAPHNQVDADMAAGMGAPDHGPRLRTEGVAMALQARKLQANISRKLIDEQTLMSGSTKIGMEGDSSRTRQNM